jgi:hypothetical protein
MNCTILQKLNLNSKDHNCLIDCNTNGTLEVTTLGSINANDELVCWYSKDYISKIKSKRQIVHGGNISSFVNQKYFHLRKL